MATSTEPAAVPSMGRDATEIQLPEPAVESEGTQVECLQDGQYAWCCIVPGVFAVAFAVMGVQYCAGVMQSAFLDAFGESDSTTSWVTAVAIGMLMLSMGPAGYLNGKIGPRLLVMTGGVMASLGLLISSFVDSLWPLFFTYSILCGVGQGFAYLGAVSLTQSWFSPSKRAMAMAIASSGSGFGTASLGPMTQHLDESESWRWSMRVLSLVSLILICGAALLFKPEPFAASQTKKKSQVTWMEVITDVKLLYFCLVLFVLGLGVWNPQVHNVEVAENNGWGENAATNANLFGFSAGAVIGRPVLAETFGMIGRRNGFPIILGMLALFAGLGPVMVDEIWKIVVNNFFYGVAFGAWISILPPIAAELVGMSKLSTALGFMYASPGITMMVGPPICGYMKDDGDPAHAYDTAYYLSGAVMGVACLMSIPMAFWENKLTVASPPSPKPEPEDVQTAEKKEPPADEEMETTENELPSDGNQRMNDKYRPTDHVPTNL